MKVLVKKLHPDAIIPTKATPGSACYDVTSLKRVSLETIWSGVYSCGTGLAFAVPSGYFLEIRPRSGLSSKGIIIPNSPGTLDSDYRGELIILLFTLALPCIVKAGDRIAQIRLVPYEPIQFVEVDELPPTERGEGGFGSTGE